MSCFKKSSGKQFVKKVRVFKRKARQPTLTEPKTSKKDLFIFMFLNTNKRDDFRNSVKDYQLVPFDYGESEAISFQWLHSIVTYLKLEETALFTYWIWLYLHASFYFEPQTPSSSSSSRDRIVIMVEISNGDGVEESYSLGKSSIILNPKTPYNPAFLGILGIQETVEMVEILSKTVKEIVPIPATNNTPKGEETCRICLESMMKKRVCRSCQHTDCRRYSVVTKMICSHVFHGYCIYKWLAENRSCPLCRCSFPEYDVSV